VVAALTFDLIVTLPFGNNMGPKKGRLSGNLRNANIESKPHIPTNIFIRTDIFLFAIIVDGSIFTNDDIL
jgi:hypothetical protein